MPAKANLIQRCPPSRRSSIWEAQSRLTAKVIIHAGEQLVRTLGLRDATELHWDRIGSRLFELPEYTLLCDTLYACGWVCTDFPLNDFLPEVNGDVAGTVGRYSLPKLRLYLHTLARGEKWCDGDGTVILPAYASGALQTVAKRLQEDETLYEPWDGTTPSNATRIPENLLDEVD